MLAHPTQHRLEILGEVPLRSSDLVSQAETPQLLQSAGTKRLAEGVARNSSGPNDPVRAGLAEVDGKLHAATNQGVACTASFL
jgi:hypothetical protein